MILKGNSKSSKIVIVIGLLFIAIGIICNEWTVAFLFDPAGAINTLRTRIIVWSFDIICISLGSVFLIFRAKNFTKNLSLTFLSIIICLLISEIFLRFITPSDHLTTNAFRYTYDPNIGVWQEDPHDSRPYINSFGMYDRHRHLKKQPDQLRIAILGDSVMNGIHAGLGYRMSDLIDKHLGDEAESLNFGMSGVGTVQKLFIYKSKVRQFKPDIVILGFLPGNDVRNNSIKIELSNGSEHTFLKYARYCVKTNSGDFIYCPPKEKYLMKREGLSLPLPILLQRSLKLLHKISHLTAQKDKKPLWGRPWPSPYAGFGAYGPPIHQEWENAWDITEHTLLVLKNEIEKDGAKFILVILTDAVQILPNPKDRILKLTGIVPPEDFDVDYPTNRLVEFAASHNIECINLLPVFRKYAKEHNLQEPYFSLKSDSHWSKLGHSVAADTVSKYLIKRIEH